ncbi:MAG: hypothetical protein KDD42_01325 [Bdellovibrionales bacterium]|nr:hypothetical protein [Bdellovibrionales bacterium]
MDSGHVIPGLNEEWTLAGAKLNEWICGVGAFMMCQFLFEKPTRAMPLLIAILVGTALGLAAVRRRFPDEEKGLRNFCFMIAGVQPPGIPAPSALQPLWSGAPLRELPDSYEFMQLGLHQVFSPPSEEEADL